MFSDVTIFVYSKPNMASTSRQRSASPSSEDAKLVLMLQKNKEEISTKLGTGREILGVADPQ
jgi:hypothetical protein